MNCLVYARGDFKKACVLLQQVEWNAVFNDEDVDKCWETVYRNITLMYTKESPSIKEKSTVDQPSYNQGNEAQKSTI